MGRVHREEAKSLVIMCLLYGEVQKLAVRQQVPSDPKGMLSCQNIMVQDLRLYLGELTAFLKLSEINIDADDDQNGNTYTSIPYPCC